MRNKFIVTILLSLGAAALSSGIELKAADYIDMTVMNGYTNVDRIFLKDFIEKHGSENPEETAQALEKLSESLDGLSKKWVGEEKPEFDDTFNVRDELPDEKYQFDSLLVQLEYINRIVADPAGHYNRFGLEYGFLGMIKTFFGQNLDGFAAGGKAIPGDLTRLHAFLLKYTKIVLSHHLDGPIRLLSGSRHAWLASFFIKRNSKSEQTTASACRRLSDKFGLELEIYTWARLLMPEKFPGGKVPKMVELWKDCALVRYQRTYTSMMKS